MITGPGGTGKSTLARLLSGRLGWLTDSPSHRLFASTKEAFVEAYLADRRSDELRVLRRLAPQLKLCRSRVWLLTLVAKQDLWVRSQSEIERHYRDGDYEAELQAIEKALGSNNFRHELLFGSMVISSLTTRSGEVINANEGGYDHKLQLTSVRRLLEVVAALKDWEVTR